ncbi:hypothetical protein RJ640_023402 [Escallonia rubra]|uniref:Bet v I/Major latex protein domain-containing protein n=1 Tax=Escallonia rubra TaxID=112253 RepID=A0AA88QNF2_9ASTE|nr:hypothetical protein RJ640_023402 [Escallonia rubra]
MKVTGSLSAETEVCVPASEAWDIYGSGKVVGVVVPKLFKQIDVVSGDGSPGTILEVTFHPGGPPTYQEIIHTVDNEKMVKEIDIYKGGFLDQGFNLFRIRWDIIAKDEKSCIVKLTLILDIKEESMANLSHVSIVPFVGMMTTVNNYLIENHKD